MRWASCVLAFLGACSFVCVKWHALTKEDLTIHKSLIGSTSVYAEDLTIHKPLIGSTSVSAEDGGALSKALQKSFLASVEEGANRHDVVSDSSSINSQSIDMEWVQSALKGFRKLSMGLSSKGRNHVEFGGGRSLAVIVKKALHKLLVIAFGGREASTSDELGVVFREDILRFASALQINEDGHTIPAETRAKGCVELMLTMFVAMLAAPMNTVAVEYGTMMGYSTRCLAAGARMALLAGAHAGDGSFFAFDRFDYCPKWKPTWKSSSMAGKEAWLLQGDHYRQQVQHNILPYNVTLTKGTLGADVIDGASVGSPSLWGDRVASVVSIDGGKDRAFWNTVTTLFMPSLKIGSLILAADSMGKGEVMCVQIGTILGALVRGGYVELVHAADRESFTTWVVLKEVPGDLITNFKFRSVSAHLWDSLWNSFEHQRMEILTQVYGANMNVDADITRLQQARTCCKHLR